MKLLPNIYQICGPVLTHRFDACGYLLPREDCSLILVDCGTPEGYNQLLENVRSLGFDPSRIKDIYGTHGHYDHVGAAFRFAEDFGTRLHLHQADVAQVEKGDGVLTSASLLYGVPFPPTSVNKIMQDGESFDCLAGRATILHTPGHSAGSCCIALSHNCGMRLLIAGDTLHGGCSAKIGSNCDAWRASLDCLCNEHFDLYSFGHCGPQLYADANRRIQALRQSFDNYQTPWFKDFFRKYDY